MEDQDELLDLVDQNDNVIDVKTRAEVYAHGIRNFRVINAFIVNSKGEIWTPRRTAQKSIAPLGLDMSVAGHVSSGETYDESLKREASEELNIDLNVIPYREIASYKTDEQGLYCFGKVYEIKMDTTPKFNPDDIIEGYWLTPAQIIERIDGGDKHKSDLPILIKWQFLK